MRSAAGLWLRLMREAPCSTESDVDLLARYADHRDEAALADLIRRYAGLVWSVCRRQLRQHADAEDAFQAVFLILAKKPKTVRNGASLAAWLHGTAYRTATRLRQRRAVVSLTETTPAQAESTLADGVMLLDEELLQLPEKLRRPLVACYLREQTQDEAAASLGVSISTLKRRLEQGRVALRLRLERRGFELGAILILAAVGTPSLPALLPSATLTLAVAGIVPAGLQSLVNGAILLMWQTKLRAWAVGAIVTTAAATSTGVVALSGQGQGPGPGAGNGSGPPAAAKPADPKPVPPKAEPPKPAGPVGEPRKLTEQEKEAIYVIDKAKIQLERAELAIKMGEWELQTTSERNTGLRMAAEDKILKAKEERLTAQRNLKRAETELAEFAKYFGDRDAYKKLNPPAPPLVPPPLVREARDLPVRPKIAQPQTELDKLLESRVKASDDWLALFDERYKDMMNLQSITVQPFLAAVDMAGKRHRAQVEWKNDPESVRAATTEYLRRLGQLHDAAYLGKFTADDYLKAQLYVKYEYLNAHILLKQLDGQAATGR